MSGIRPLNLCLTAHAERDLLDIPHELRQRIKADLLALAKGYIPFAQLKKLKGFAPPVWQLTSGRFRVLYRREPEVLLILRVVPKPAQQHALRSLR